MSSGLGNLTVSMNEFTNVSGHILRQNTDDFKKPSEKSKAHILSMIVKTRVQIERNMFKLNEITGRQDNLHVEVHRRASF